MTSRVWTGGGWPRLIVWAVLSGGSVAVLTVPRFLTFYDYPEWMLQGRILHDLWVGATSRGIPVAETYALLPVPVPNLAAPAGIALLALVLPIEAAGRVFLMLGVLGFGHGYGFLVRRLQGQPTALELTGFLWAFGYFLQRGYVSYLFGLPIAFVGIAVAHRMAHRSGSPARLVALGGLQVVAFLAHLVAWGVLALAVGGYAVALFRRDRRAAALRLLATTAPPLVLLAWYTAAARETHHVALYSSLRDKLVSLAETVQFFPRLDPYSGVVPSFPAQLLVMVAFIVVVGAGVRWSSARTALRTPVGAVALLLIAVALLDPVGNLNSLDKPDQRLLLPGVLLLLAALPWARARHRAVGAVSGAVLAALVLHGVALASMNAPLERAFAALDAAVPDDAAVATLAVPADGGCGPALGPSIGIPALKWFDVYRMLRRDEVNAQLQETSGVVRRAFAAGPVLTPLSTSAAAAPAAVMATSARYVEVFACQSDLDSATAALDGRYAPVSAGSGFAVLRVPRRLAPGSDGPVRRHRGEDRR